MRLQADAIDRAIPRRRTPVFVAGLLMILVRALPASGAVGCDLNDPDRDVARLYPGSTGYRTTYASIEKRGGEPLLRKIEARLGDRFRGLYETIDVPYTIYTIYAGTNLIGYIHGVNEKGQYGGIQVFVALDLRGRITSFYIQKLTSRWSKALRNPGFGSQFTGLTLKDFEGYAPVTGNCTGKAADIRNPDPEAAVDYSAILRGVKKNLILMDEFVFSVNQESP